MGCCIEADITETSVEMQTFTEAEHFVVRSLIRRLRGAFFFAVNELVKHVGHFEEALCEISSLVSAVFPWPDCRHVLHSGKWKGSALSKQSRGSSDAVAARTVRQCRC